MTCWAVLDGETSGFDAATCRVLSIAALAVDERGTVERSVVSLINPGVDPGSVQIHGLTPDRLAGKPQFVGIVPALIKLLEGRILVAHNAIIDYSFLVAEAQRCGAALPVDRVMCTVELASKLPLDVVNLKLATLAHHLRIRQTRPHDAHDDAVVLAAVLARLVHLAGGANVALPIRPVSELYQHAARAA